MRNLNGLVKLHPEAKEISFKHKFSILHAFNKRISILGFDYFSLMLVDPNQILSIYSSCPALEFNLIHHNLWQYDGIFDVSNHKADSFIFWNTLYKSDVHDLLLDEKERKFGFQFGFYIMKYIEQLFAIYSYATKSQTDREMYKESKDILTKIGDYFFFELEKVHRQYTTFSNGSLTNNHDIGKIRLIVNNTKGST